MVLRARSGSRRNRLADRVKLSGKVRGARARRERPLRQRRIIHDVYFTMGARSGRQPPSDWLLDCGTDRIGCRIGFGNALEVSRQSLLHEGAMSDVWRRMPTVRRSAPAVSDGIAIEEDAALTPTRCR